MRRLLIVAALLLLPAAAYAQNTPALSAEEIANMLSPGAGSSVAYTADDLAAILAPSQATRSLKGGGEPRLPASRVRAWCRTCASISPAASPRSTRRPRRSWMSSAGPCSSRS